MSEINIRRRHALGQEAARRLAEAMAMRLNQRFELTSRWEGDALCFERDGVYGALTVGDGEIHIQARLGFLVSLARARIEEEIVSSLDHLLDAAPHAHARRRAPGRGPSET